MNRKTRTLLFLPLSALPLCGQTPPSPDRPWPVSGDSRFQAEMPRALGAANIVDSNHLYTLAELVDLAERNNPETRVGWERAKQQAAGVGIARSALYPTVAALASASISQYSLFFGKFYHEDVTMFPATLNLSYTVLDFGARGAGIDLAKANLLAANFAFNDTHRKIIFQATEAYYRLLDAMGQEDAAQATLADAQTVQQAVEERLANGLATLPDVLEARAAAAQARYELASIQGLEEITRGGLATVLGVSPTIAIHVEDISRRAAPEIVEEPVEALIDRALARRPDLLAQVARVRATDAEIKQARSAYYPTVTFSGDWGHTHSFGQQNYGPTAQSSIFPYQAQLNINWTLLDGGARRNQLARAEAERREAQAQMTSARDQIENEIWTSYSNLKTAQRQQEAADALVQAADQSYAAEQEAFQSGVRTFIDVTTAQRDLARARSAQVSARTQLLTSVADLAFRAGDLMRIAQPPPAKP